MHRLARELAVRLGFDCASDPEREIGGSSAHRCYRWRSAEGVLFVKTAPASASARLAAEAAGLKALAEAHVLRVPQVRAQGIAGDDSFIALEWIEARPNTAGSEQQLARGLAALHAVRGEQFGWDAENYIGRSPQLNGWYESWAAFWRDRRLRPQLELAMHQGYGRLLEAPGARVLEAVEAILAQHQPVPSLLHGDLWAGNWSTDVEGQPVIFDPAVYFGDRETDLAMTRLFGGFDDAFYAVYEDVAPLPDGHALRADLYNLYHVLNHANLFGGGYVEQARILSERLLAQVHR
ncbi:MAG: fructosamine kinase family protein [Steroidobacteraceae bacterium]